MRQFANRFLAVLLFLLALTFLGTAGYMWIEGASLGDALYMSAITLTAVGFQEVFPLSTAGRGFTMVLLVGGFAWMGIWFAVITSLIVELDLRQVFRKRRVMKAINEMSDHVIICGAGRTGRQVAEELTAMGQRFILIEQDADVAESFYEFDPDVKVVVGNATADHVLQEGGVSRACGLISCISADSDNLFVCLSARALNPELRIVVRAQDEETIEKMYRAGADHVVSPLVSGAIQMASVVVRPGVLSFLDVTTRSSGISLRLEEATVGDRSRLAGQALSDARIPQETGLLVIAVRKVGGNGEGDFVFNPDAETRLEPGDQVVVLGRPDQVSRLREYVG
jgi:voltage-gated potassium channel